MKLFLLTALTMLAFAANSVLNRAAVADGGIDPTSFGVIRLVAGAVILAGLTIVLRGGVTLRGPGRLAGVTGLLVYIFGFSIAYRALDAGLGALILFGTVQVTMFAGSLFAGETPPRRRWVGAGLAFAGLVWLLWPSDAHHVSLLHALAMAVAGIGWGVYSLVGRKAFDGLSSTAANFVLAAPIAVVLGAVFLGVSDARSDLSGYGVALAVISGGITSGLGYALWYSLLPRLAGTVAAVAQLTVPVIAMVGGMVFLSEDLSIRFVLATAIVLGGVGVSILPKAQSA